MILYPLSHDTDLQQDRYVIIEHWKAFRANLGVPAEVSMSRCY